MSISGSSDSKCFDGEFLQRTVETAPEKISVASKTLFFLQNQTKKRMSSGSVRYQASSEEQVDAQFQRDQPYGGYGGMPMKPYKKCPYPGVEVLMIALAVVLAAVIIGGLVFGIWICVNKANNDPTTFEAWKVGFYGAVAAGGLVFVISVIVYCVWKYQYRFRRYPVNGGYY